MAPENEVVEAVENSAQAPASNPGGDGGQTQNAAPSGDSAAAPGAMEGKSPPGEVAPAVEGEESLTPATPAYKPRDKFKVMDFGADNQKEIDVPAFIKPLMKDAASEKEVISLLEKAYGLDFVKQSRVAVQQDRDKIKADYTSVQNQISKVRQTFQRGDIDSFLDQLAIPQERMLQWALDKVNYSQLSPEQQRILDDRQEAKRKAWQAEEQVMTVEERFQEQARQTKQVLLQSVLARPDVSAFAKSFDEQAGKPHAFFEEIKAHGEMTWYNQKIDLTPDQAVEQVMKKWAKFIPSAPSANGQQAEAPGGATVVAPTNKPAVIPNVQGRTTSPTGKQGPRSIDDLRKIRAAQ